MFLIELFKYVDIDLSGNIGDVMPVTIVVPVTIEV